jgi:hypothetical protein
MMEMTATFALGTKDRCARPQLVHHDISGLSEFRRYPGLADIDQAAPIRLDP